MRTRLSDLDRLREVWTGHQIRRPGHQWADNRVRLFRRHILELRALAGRAPVSSELADRLVARGWDAGDLLAPELREELRLEERALVAMAADCRAGRDLTPEYLDTLTRSLTGVDSTVPAGRFGDCLAAATAARTHPVIRAALVYLCSENALREAGGADAGLRHDPLPWAMASLVLMRANHPPLVADHRPLSSPSPGLDPQGRLVQIVELFVELEIAAMRGELSWAAGGGETGPGGCGEALARAVYRRLLDRLRQRAATLSMVLREIDPATTVRVTAGDLTDEGRHGDRMDSAAERALFVRGASWWVCLETGSADAELRLLLTLQEVGAPSTGVLAVTADARLETPDGSEDVLDLGCTDCVTLVSTDTADERWPAVAELADEVISRAVGRLTTVMA
ncbi:hypothetical protein EV190_10960 [Actinorugispora endophytica]|uniref:Uncharacterized protein n=1 Tax=Actinorugispora endophytica TaxID=1605990 RepID=A0A4R6UWZ8_9ACTN|nr:hypothetical protein EV190_10960 [Actinorugispora endophytica]